MNLGERLNYYKFNQEVIPVVAAVPDAKNC